MGKEFTPPTRYVSYGKEQKLDRPEMTVARKNQDLPTNEEGQFPNGIELSGFDSVFKTVVNSGKNSIRAISSIDGSGDVVVPWTPYGTILDTSSGFNTGTGVTSVTLPDSLLRIEERAFYGPNEVASVLLPDSLEAIGDLAFYYSAISTIDIPKKCLSIGQAAFAGALNLTTVSISSTVTLGSFCFDGCSALSSISLGKALESIGVSCFATNTSLASIDIPDTITSIEQDAFFNCTALATILIRAKTAPTFGSTVFSGVPATEIHVPEGSTGYAAAYDGIPVVYDL